MEATAIAGWESLVVEVATAGTGLRVLHVTLDAAGTPLSASDHVLLRHDDGRVVQESIGGRIEADGGFTGTHWLAEGIDRDDGGDIDWHMTPRAPADAEIRGLLALVAEIMRRDRA